MCNFPLREILKKLYQPYSLSSLQLKMKFIWRWIFILKNKHSKLHLTCCSYLCWFLFLEITHILKFCSYLCIDLSTDPVRWSDPGLQDIRKPGTGAGLTQGRGASIVMSLRSLLHTGNTAFWILLIVWQFKIYIFKHKSYPIILFWIKFICRLQNINWESGDWRRRWHLSVTTLKSLIGQCPRCWPRIGRYQQPQM